jgi:hypothetical protein
MITLSGKHGGSRRLQNQNSVAREMIGASEAHATGNLTVSFANPMMIDHRGPIAVGTCKREDVATPRSPAGDKKFDPLPHLLRAIFRGPDQSPTAEP